MQYYARRVGAICIYDDHNHGQWPISPSVWTFLARWCAPGQGLLPRLKRIESLVVAQADPGLILLFSPSLRYLDLKRTGKFAQSIPWTSHVIAEVAERTVYPHLHSLHVDSPQFLRSPGEGLPLSARLVNLYDLEIAHRVLVETPFLQALATLRELRTLSIWMRVRALDGCRLPPGSLSKLCDITLRADPLSLWRFLRVTSPRRLKTCTLHIIDWFRCTDAEAVRHVHAALSQCISLSATKLTLTLAADGPRVAHLLAPALAFHWLTHVHITVDSYIPELVVSAAELYTFAAAWPSLVVFELALARCDEGNEVLSVPDPPVAGTLVELAGQLPRLERLTLPYLSLIDEDIPDVYTVPAGERALKELRVCVTHDGYWDPTLRREFAILVDWLFPHLDVEDIPCTSVDNLNDYVDWKAFSDLLVTLRAGREHTRELRRRRKLQKRPEIDLSGPGHVWYVLAFSSWGRGLALTDRSDIYRRRPTLLNACLVITSVLI